MKPAPWYEVSLYQPEPGYEVRTGKPVTCALCRRIIHPDWGGREGAVCKPCGDARGLNAVVREDG